MTAKRKSSKKIKVTQGSGNVFADLGLPHAEQELMKARLTLQIHQIIQKRGLTQTEAGKILGIPQPKVSALARNRAGTFSVGRLMEFLTALGAGRKNHCHTRTEAAGTTLCSGCLTAEINTTSLAIRYVALAIRRKKTDCDA